MGESLSIDRTAFATTDAVADQHSLTRARMRDRIVALPRGIDVCVTTWMARHCVLCLRVSLGIVFLWFGALKLFPGLSPAQNLAARTIAVLTFGAIQPAVSLVVLASWECLIGLGLICRAFTRATLLLLFTQMAGTLTPLVFFRNELFNGAWYAPTLEGQYIIKNLVFISAGVVIGATVRGGAMVVDPEA